MKTIIVLVTQGKGRSTVDYVTVELFDDIDSADKFCDEKTDLDSKYWTLAEIVEPNEMIEVYYPT